MANDLIKSNAIGVLMANSKSDGDSLNDCASRGGNGGETGSKCA